MEKSLSGLIYLFDIYSKAYCKRNKITFSQFSELDDKIHILDYIERCQDDFDKMPTSEGMRFITRYVKQYQH